jgi:hypothetical protein
MLKLLHKNDTQTTPFVVTKNWNLSNVINEDTILMEHSGSDGLPVGVEYVIFGPYYPITASNCDIALENQSADLANYRDGVKLSGTFYPNSDPQNVDGTYQRIVYSQVVNMFYNSYRDPTKIWGLEQIDFDKSQTKRFLSDKFKMFEIPQFVYGEKIIPQTITMYDRTTDNDYVIVDDGNCNLFAGTNIFAHQQELGEFDNTFFTGSLAYCDFYNTIHVPDEPIMSLQYNGCIPSITVNWNINGWPVTNYVVEKSEDGITFNQIFNGLAFTYTDTEISYSYAYWYRMYAVNLLGTSSYTPSASISASYIMWDTDSDMWDTAGTSCGPIYWVVIP